MGSVNKKMTDLKFLLRTLGRNTEVAVLTVWLCKIYAYLIQTQSGHDFLVQI